MTPIQRTLAFVALGLAACSSGATAPSEPAAPPAGTPEQPSSEFEIAVSADKLPVLQGANASIEVTLTRKNGFAGAVTVTATGLPTGATAEPLTFEGDAAKATLTVKAGTAAPHSLPANVTLIGTSGLSEVKRSLTVTVHGPPGSLDTSFADGKVVVNVGESDDYAYALAVQPDGKILVAGRVSDGLGAFALGRLERDGTPDTSFGSGGSDCSSDGGLGTSSSISGARLVPEGSTAVLIVDGSATVSACFDSLIPTSRIEMREKDVGLGIKTKVPVVVTAPSGPSRTVLATEAFSARVPIEFFKQGDGYALRAGEIDTTLKNDPSSELARYLGTAVASDVASAAEGSTLSVEPMWAAPPALSGFKATLESASFSDNNGTLSADFGVVLDVPRDSIDEVLKIGVD